MEAGAHIINDVWGFQRDKEMADVAAKFQCPSIVMHNKVEAVYNDLMSELMAFLRKSIDLGVSAGLPKSPDHCGSRFRLWQNYGTQSYINCKITGIERYRMPYSHGSLQKKNLGLILDAPPDQRLEGDSAITAMSILNGADMVRVHDVREMVNVAKIADAVAAAGY